MDQVYKLPIERLMVAGVKERQYELQSNSWDKVQEFLREINISVIRNRQAVPDSVNSFINKGDSSRIFDTGIASDSSHVPV